MTTRIGVDIGGTFTDLVFYDEESGEVRVEKVPTTPEAPELGCVEAIKLVATSNEKLSHCEYFLHGTTVGLNALIERRGAVVGLLCTEGFRDILEIRRGSRPEVYDLSWVPPAPLVPRHLRCAVHERMDANGKVVAPLDALTVADALNVFNGFGVTSVGICLINSYVNPKHELEAANALRAAGFKGDISLSHQLSREYRDYERTSTTVVDAFVRTRMAQYLENIADGLAHLDFKGTCLITRSGGGSMTFEEARTRAFETVNSGPVAGVEGAAELARTLDIGDLITADVGGTSFDTALILGGRPQLLYQGDICGMPVQAAWVDVRSIGAGGGSVASIDAGGLLHVGPESAGAVPGPACYRRGGEKATVTDAAFYLGMLGQGNLASNMTLSKDLAEDALTRLADRLGMDAVSVAIGIMDIACSACANAIREITVEQGIDPRHLKLLSFGGAGPLLASQIARELDIATIIVPPFAGNFSAWGLLGSDVVRSASRTRRVPVSAEGIEAVNDIAGQVFGELTQREEANRVLEGGVQELAVGARFTGQEHSLTISVPWESGRVACDYMRIEHAFRNAYQAIFGMSLDNPVEIIVIRASIRKRLPRSTRRRPVGGPPADDSPTSCQIYSFALKAVVDGFARERRSLVVNKRYPGPAVIYEETTTTYVDADCTYWIDENECLVLRRTKELM